MALFMGTRTLWIGRTAEPGRRNVTVEDAEQPAPRPALLPGQPDGGAAQPAGTEPAAAAADDSKKASPHPIATVAAVFLFVAGVIVAVNLFLEDGGPTFSVPEGLGAFVLFYVAAQAAERFVEMVLPAFEKIPGLDKKASEALRDKAVAAATNSEDPAADQTGKQAANAQVDVEQRRANRAAVAFAFTAVLGMALCAYLDAGFLTAIGVSFGDDAKDSWPQALEMAVTGLVIGGGSKQLHDLITRVSKKIESQSTPAATGGQQP